MPELRPVLYLLVRQRQYELPGSLALAALVCRQRYVVPDASAQQRHTPCPAPAAQAQRVFDGLPALAVLAALPAHVDEVFVALAAIPPHQCRGLVTQLLEQPRHRRLGLAPGVLLARTELRLGH